MLLYLSLLSALLSGTFARTDLAFNNAMARTESATFHINNYLISSVRPCTLCIVVTHASVSGNCKCLISDPCFPLAKTTTSYLVKGTAWGTRARCWLVLTPTLLLSNLTRTLVTSLLLLVTTWTAPFTRPSDTSTFAVSITRAPIASLSVYTVKTTCFRSFVRQRREGDMNGFTSYRINGFIANCALCWAKVRVFRVSTSAFNLYTCEVG